MPVGNVEAFYGAIEGGADAVYLGLKAFNARGRAANFNNYQFLQLLDEAKKRKVKVFVTLNTVIKNKEIPELLDTLSFLSKTNVDAVIIQDWGTYFLIKKNFPKLVVHASTQMANHNSVGLSYSKKLKFDRVILARELTLPELNKIQQNAPVETEVFVHGALCYSFSGMCLFSSYLGGAGANRGLCTQPCRRFYKEGNENKLSFSLKDNQLIDFIPHFSKIGVSSLKIEGRLKSGEYVYKVARAYRAAIDNPQKVNEAKALLEMDMGRDKTQWFYNKHVAQAISESPNTGLFLGKIEKVTDAGFVLTTSYDLSPGNRLRISVNKDSEQLSSKIEHIEQLGSGSWLISPVLNEIKQGNQVFLAGIGDVQLPSKLKENPQRIAEALALPLKKKIGQSIRTFKLIKKPNLFVRINNLNWLKELQLNEIDQLIIHLPKRKLKDFNPNTPVLKKNQHKIWFELPQFISEQNIGFYKQTLDNLSKAGYQQFAISHLSQKDILPKQSSFLTNENVYCYNDAAAQFLYSEGAKWVTSPFENEFDNMLSGANRSQIIPLYYFPRLFYSRQPVLVTNGFKDAQNNVYRKELENGITCILPSKPVSQLQYQNKLFQKGFNQFLIDLSFVNPDQKTLKQIMLKFKQSEKIDDSSSFNFKKGLR